MKAHRVAFLITNNLTEIPSGKILCHTCDNRKCVNPQHLILETHEYNMKDRNNKGRQAKGNGTRGSKGEKNPSAKLNWIKVCEIRELRKLGKTYNWLSKKYHVSPSTIAAIARNEIWQQNQK